MSRNAARTAEIVSYASAASRSGGDRGAAAPDAAAGTSGQVAAAPRSRTRIVRGGTSRGTGRDRVAARGRTCGDESWDRSRRASRPGRLRDRGRGDESRRRADPRAAIAAAPRPGTLRGRGCRDRGGAAARDTAGRVDAAVTRRPAERPGPRGLGRPTKTQADTRARNKLLRDHWADRQLEDSRRYARVHAAPGYERLRRKHEHQTDVTTWFRALDPARRGRVDAHELVEPMAVLGIAKDRDDVEALAKAIAAHDADGDPGLDLDEFRAFVDAQGLRPADVRARAAAAAEDAKGLDPQTQILAARRARVLEALESHASAADPSEKRETQRRLRCIADNKKWAAEATVGQQMSAKASPSRRPRPLPSALAAELERRRKAAAPPRRARAPASRASQPIRSILGPAKNTTTRPSTAGAHGAAFGRYDTAASAVSKADRMLKADEGRLDRTAKAFWSGREARGGGTVGVPVYRPNNPFPDLVHVSLRDAAADAVPARRSLKAAVGGSATSLLARTRRPVTAAAVPG